MRNLRAFVWIFIILVLALPSFAGGRGQQVDTTTITLGYNPFLSDSFTDAPPPIDVIRQVLADRYPELTLEYFVMPQDILESLIIWMSTNDQTVDIYGMDVPWVTQFGRAGWAVPLTDPIPNLTQLIQPAGLDTFSWNGQPLAVPFWGGVAGLYYRTDILEEFGFSAPQSVDDMITIIETVQAQRDIDGFLWPGQREESLNMFYATLLHAFGGEYTDAQGNLNFTSAASLRALEFLRETIDQGWSPEGVQNWDRLETRQRFVEGQAIFSWDNHDIITWLDNPEQSQIAGNWNFIPFPANPGGRSVAVTGGFGFALNPNSQKLTNAAKVLEVIASPEVQRGFALAWGPVQHSPGLYDDPVVQRYNPNVQLLDPLLEVAINRPPSTNYAELSLIMQQEINGVLTGVKSAQAAADEMARRASAID